MFIIIVLYYKSVKYLLYRDLVRNHNYTFDNFDGNILLINKIQK